MSTLAETITTTDALGQSRAARASRSLVRSALGRFARDRVAMTALIIFVSVALFAIFANLVSR